MPDTDSERLAVIETIVKNIEHRLFGNGQPGELEALHSRINGHGKRLAILEKWRSWLIGIGIGLAMGTGAGLMKIIEGMIR